MKPYYEDDYVVLYHADFNDDTVREFLAATYLFSSIITDPIWPNAPKGMFNRSKEEVRQSWENICNFFQAYCKRLVVILGTDSNPIPVLRYLPDDITFIRQVTLGYDLCAPRGRLVRGNDVAYVYGQQRDIFDKNHHTIPGLISTNVHRPRGVKHPTPRPIQHMKFLAEWFGRKGMILDPCAGSGRTGIAAKELGLKCVLVECELKYCDEIVKWVRKAKAPLFYTPYKYIKKTPAAQIEQLNFNS